MSLQQVINRIKQWCDELLLKLNISKSYCMKNMIASSYIVNLIVHARNGPISTSSLKSDVSPYFALINRIQ